MGWFAKLYIYINCKFVLYTVTQTDVFTSTKHAPDRKVMKSVTGKSVT